MLYVFISDLCSNSSSSFTSCAISSLNCCFWSNSKQSRLCKRFFFFSSRRRHTRYWRDWSSDVCSSDLSRSALDFLDAPKRLSRFLDGTMIRLLTAPARAGGRAGVRLVGAGFSLFSRIISKILGGQLLHDISAFVSALDTMFGGFRERATATYELLRQPGTAFVVVAAPEPDALREASYFVDRLSSEGMPLAGLVLNRTHPPATIALSATRAEAAAEAVAEAGGTGAKLADRKSGVAGKG